MSDAPSPAKQPLLPTIDDALRGRLPDADVPFPTPALARLLLLLGAAAGICITSYQLFQGGSNIALRAAANACKVPAVLVLTACVTLPSLYVFAALQRMELTLRELLRLLLLSSVVHVAVLASLGPVFAFFAASTDSHAFLLLLNVLFWTIAGVLGIKVLHRAASGLDVSTKRLLNVWCLLYGVVGAQMGWLLRPFVGRPDEPFALLMPTEDNVLIGVLTAIGELFAR